jgi:arsenite-transporting ATPase
VGKTTCAAATAVALAEEGRRVLVVSTDPAHSLGDALDRRLGPRPRRVAGVRGELLAAEPDAARAYAAWLADRRAALRAIGERGTLLDAADVDRLLALPAPGVDELIGLVELRRLEQAARADHVVVDTAPTGHTLRLLAAPDLLARLAEALDLMQEKHRVIASALGGARRRDAADVLVEEIAALAEELRAGLRDPAETAATWVLHPERLALEEARDGVAALRASGIRVREVVVNRMTPKPGGRCASCGPRRVEEARVLAAAREAFAPAAMRVVETRAAEPRGVPALRAFARALSAPPPRASPTKGRAGRRACRPPTEPAPGPLRFAGARAATPRLLLFGGKGGVGKTTAAAATALEIARAGRRVLLLSVDPAHSLGDVLGVPLGDLPRAVPGAPRLRAREVDAAAAFADRRERYVAAVDRVFDALRGGSRMDATLDRAIARRLLDLAPPGTDELLALEAIAEGAAGGAGADDAEVIVVDTAPTGHALRLLAAPATVQTLRLLAELRALRVPVSGLLVNAVAEAGCARCRAEAARGRAAARRLARAARALTLRDTAVMLAPLTAPPPTGAACLREWAHRWHELEP